MCASTEGPPLAGRLLLDGEEGHVGALTLFALGHVFQGADLVVCEHCLFRRVEANGVRNSLRRVEGGAGRWRSVQEVELHAMPDPATHCLVADLPPVAGVLAQAAPNAGAVL